MHMLGFRRKSSGPGSTPVGGIKKNAQLRLGVLFYFAPDEGSNRAAAQTMPPWRSAYILARHSATAGVMLT